MKKREGFYLLVIVALLLVCNHLWERTQRMGVVDVIDKDTIITEPVATASKEVGTLTVSVPKIGVNVPKMEISVPNLTENVPKVAINVPKTEISVPEGESCDTVAAYTAERQVTVTDTGDGYDVDIPITQKRYEDSLYTAWVSGYRATLDSIRVRERTVIVAEKAQDRKRPWITVGVTGGVGLVGLKGETGAGWFVGLGATIPFWR